jgi:hypothetical protein
MEQKMTKVFCHRGQPVTADYTVHLPPDVRACIFWLRNRRPEQWRENRPLVEEADEDWVRQLDEASARAPAPVAVPPPRAPRGEVSAQRTEGS